MTAPYRPVAGVCAQCDTPVRPNEPYTYREVVGWEKIRKGGGANQIRWRQPTGRVLCPSCRWGDRPDDNQFELF